MCFPFRLVILTTGGQMDKTNDWKEEASTKNSQRSFTVTSTVPVCSNFVAIADYYSVTFTDISLHTVHFLCKKLNERYQHEITFTVFIFACCTRLNDSNFVVVQNICLVYLIVTALPSVETSRFGEIYNCSLRLCKCPVRYLIKLCAWRSADKLLSRLDEEVN